MEKEQEIIPEIGEPKHLRATGRPLGPRRPPKPYTLELAERICNRMANGESLSQICKDPAMPAWVTIFHWINDPRPKYDQFREMFERAQISLIYYYVYEMVDIADNSTNDYMDRELSDGRIVRELDPENVNRSRMRVDIRKWLASKLIPHKFGDKVEAFNNTTVNVAVATPVTMTAEEAEKAYRNMLTGPSPDKK